MMHYRRALAASILVTIMFQSAACEAPELMTLVGVESTSPARIAQMIRQRWAANPVAGERMVRIARCESGLTPNPPGNRTHHGVFQLGDREWRDYGRGQSPYNAAANINAAYRLWRARGTQPWVCRG